MTALVHATGSRISWLKALVNTLLERFCNKKEFEDTLRLIYWLPNCLFVLFPNKHHFCFQRNLKIYNKKNRATS